MPHVAGRIFSINFADIKSNQSPLITLHSRPYTTTHHAPTTHHFSGNSQPSTSLHHNFSCVEVVLVVVVVVLSLHMSGSEFVEMEMLVINLQSFLLNVQVYISKVREHID
jgi:hypothetical protein